MRARPYGLGFAFLGPSLVLLILFFFAPVLLTGVFAFTNMSTATGIGSGYYTVTPSLLRDLKAEGIGKAADELSQGAFVVSPETLEAARAAAALVPQGIEFASDVHVSDDYRREAAVALVRRAILEAADNQEARL